MPRPPWLRAVLAGLALAAASARADSAPPSEPAKSAPQAAAAPAAGTAASQVQPLNHDLAATRKLLAGVPALAPLATEFTPFETADVDAALRRGTRSRDSITVWAFQPATFSWKPAAGRELWVVTGRSGKRAVLAVLERRPNGEIEHAASALIEEPETSIAVGYAASAPSELLWTTCYGCAGEGGTIRLRTDGRVEIVFR